MIEAEETWGSSYPELCFLHAALSVLTCVKTWVCITVKSYAFIHVLFGCINIAAKHLHVSI